MATVICKERFGFDHPEDHYIEDAACSNCGRKTQVLIPKGTLKSEVEMQPCIRCGCPTMRVL